VCSSCLLCDKNLLKQDFNHINPTLHYKQIPCMTPWFPDRVWMSTSTIEGNDENWLGCLQQIINLRRCSEVIREEDQTNLRNVIMITCQQGKQLNAIINKITRINTHCLRKILQRKTAQITCWVHPIIQIGELLLAMVWQLVLTQIIQIVTIIMVRKNYIRTLGI
jgi:hypothetical protein